MCVTGRRRRRCPPRSRRRSRSGRRSTCVNRSPQRPPSGVSLSNELSCLTPANDASPLPQATIRPAGDDASRSRKREGGDSEYIRARKAVSKARELCGELCGAPSLRARAGCVLVSPCHGVPAARNQTRKGSPALPGVCGFSPHAESGDVGEAEVLCMEQMARSAPAHTRPREAPLRSSCSCPHVATANLDDARRLSPSPCPLSSGPRD